MLIDGGGFPEGTFDVGENVVSSFLWRKGIKKIDYLVLTHAHPDHLNGLKAVSKNFKIGEFWEAFSPSENEDYEELQKKLPESTVAQRLFRGTSHQEGRVKIDILHPEEREFTVSRVHNDDSLVLRITSGQISFLLPGDIGVPVEKDILEEFPGIRCQVLKSPHHGSRTSSSEDLLRAIAPRIVVISVGAGNVYGFPDKEVLERYERIGAKVYRTDIHGSVEITLRDQDITVRTASSKPKK
jgi:competence protein ComEC